jgi:hypothetical protein
MSFGERVLSAANIVLTEGKTCLSSTTIEMLEIMARRKNYPQLSR